MRTLPQTDTNITITADEPGLYGASHAYTLTVTDTIRYNLHFQEGPIREAGINGISNEALLAVIIDRIRGFQSSRLPCRENAIALTHLETAALWLEQRTLNRKARGIEGTGKDI